jgi:hypothetical protein
MPADADLGGFPLECGVNDRRDVAIALLNIEAGEDLLDFEHRVLHPEQILAGSVPRKGERQLP